MRPGQRLRGRGRSPASDSHGAAASDRQEIAAKRRSTDPDRFSGTIVELHASTVDLEPLTAVTQEETPLAVGGAIGALQLRLNGFKLAYRRSKKSPETGRRESEQASARSLDPGAVQNPDLVTRMGCCDIRRDLIITRKTRGRVGRLTTLQKQIDRRQGCGGIQNAVRAPSIGELFSPINTSFPSIGAPSATGIQGDPCDVRSSYRTGANAAQARALCLAQGISASAIDTYTYSNNQVPGITGGNPNLIEETSESFTVGLVWQSRFDNAWLGGLSAAVDYYDIEITDGVGTIGAAQQLQGCFNAQGQNPTFSASNVFCQLFSRDPLSGNVNNSIEANANLATLRTSGVDLQVDWRADMADIGLPAWGALDLNVVVGWLENRENQIAAGLPFIDRTGTIDSVFGNTFPEWKSLTGLNWRNGDFTAGMRWRRVGEMTQFGTANVIPTTDYFDLLGSWAVNDAVSLRVTVNNLTDEQPPVYSPGVQANTDPSTYDTLGRRYSIGLTARF
jgi:hypothetical protein